MLLPADAVRHLISLGHEKIGYIGETCNEIRYQAYCNTLADHHIAFDKNVIANVPGSSEGGYQGARQVLKRSSKVTAFFCMNDITAIGAIRAIKECGYHIPNDIAVISMDDIDIAQYISSHAYHYAHPHRRNGPHDRQAPHRPHQQRPHPPHEAVPALLSCEEGKLSVRGMKVQLSSYSR